MPHNEPAVVANEIVNENDIFSVFTGRDRDKVGFDLVFGLSGRQTVTDHRSAAG